MGCTAVLGAPDPWGMMVARLSRIPNGYRELLIFLGAYVAYSLVRGLASGAEETALQNAEWVMRVQESVGIGIERGVQEALIGLPVMDLLNWVYLIAQFAVVPVALVWMYRRNRQGYLVLRTTLLVAWFIALPIYWLVPTAPPRLSGAGFIDTVNSQTPLALDSPLVTVFYNPFAAIPSLHSAFAFTVGIAIALVAHRSATRATGLLWGPVVAVAVVATGNHFVLDIVLGLVVATAGAAVAFWIHLPGARPRRWRPAPAESGGGKPG